MYVLSTHITIIQKSFKTVHFCPKTALFIISALFFYFDSKLHNWWRQRSHKAVTKDLTKPHMAWEQDYHLQDPGRLALFDEYLEMSEFSSSFWSIDGAKVNFTICVFLGLIKIAEPCNFTRIFRD